jgi:hypothetical protein
MQEQYATEIRELHQFFQDWFTGAIGQSEENFSRVTSGMNEHFALISPDGTLAEYPTVISWLRDGYGSRPNFHLWTDKIVMRHQAGDLALATYEEWQEIDGKINARLSTALLQTKAGAPNGVEWLHVHETWLPADSRTVVTVLLSTGSLSY